MIHAELHLAVRRLVAGRPYPFLIGVSSIEQHPGRIEVEWTITIFVEHKPRVYAKALTPEAALEKATFIMSDKGGPSLPPELESIGAPPIATGDK